MHEYIHSEKTNIKVGNSGDRDTKKQNKDKKYQTFFAFFQKPFHTFATFYIAGRQNVVILEIYNLLHLLAQ